MTDENQGPLFTSRRRERRSDGPPLVPIVMGVLLVAAVGAWWFWLRSPETPVEPRTPVPGAEMPADTAVRDPTAGVPPLDLPPVEASDTFVREQLDDLSDDPLLGRWLGADDLVRRYVTAVVNLAAGASPAGQLPFLRPEGAFEVRETEGGALVIDEVSYDRYDPLVDAVESVDVEVAARLYRQLYPLFDEVYRGLGLPEPSFDAAVARALGTILAVEVPEGPVEVLPTGVVYEFRDPRLEDLAPAAKHVIRLGPENARRLQARTRDLVDALGIVPREPGS